jgi:HEAT repeat protein
LVIASISIEQWNSPMSARSHYLLVFCLMAGAGCSSKKSTDQLIADLKSPDEKDRIVAVRLLADRKNEADKVVPALTEALQDKENDIRLSAAIGLGYFGDKARESLPPLQAALRDRDPRVREAASIAIARISPELAPKTNLTHGKTK